MTISLACSCGARAEVVGLDVWDAEHAAESAGWVTHALAHSGGRVVLVDVCPSCNSGAAPVPVNAGAGLAPSRPCAAPRRSPERSIP